MLLCNTSPTIQVSCHLVLTCPSCDTFKVGPLAPCPGQTQVLAVSVTACLIWLHLDLIQHSQPNSSKSSVIGVQVTALAELQQAPALTPAQVVKLPDLADGAAAEPDEAGLVQPLQPLPVTLPECTISDRAIRQHSHYSLPQHLQHRDPLYSQISVFKSWCTTLVQLNRHSKAICSGSLSNVMADLLLFLGFLHHFLTAAQRGHANMSSLRIHRCTL